MADIAQTYSPLAWEFANRCAEFRIATEPRGVEAFIYLRDGRKMAGVGPTTDRALHELARGLDRYNER